MLIEKEQPVNHAPKTCPTLAKWADWKEQVWLQQEWVEEKIGKAVDS